MSDISPIAARSIRVSKVRIAGFALALLAMPVFALVALALGKEAGWDFQNYHWYDPYALLHGRLGFDIAVAHHATYYNPFLDVPLYLLGAHFPAWVAGAWMGVEAGIAAALLGGIAYRVIKLDDPVMRLAVSTLLAIAGMIGGGTLGEIGKTSDDIAAGLGILAALFLLVSRFDRVVRANKRDLIVILGIAGILAGASPGLKLTTVPYVVGLSLAMLALPGTPFHRFSRAFAFGVGVILGIGIFGGYWFWSMWRFSGNPIFPYFNDLFASPLVPPGSYRDPTFLPKDGWTRLMFPFVFSADSLKVAEWKFRDVHIAIAYVLVPLGGLFVLFGRQAVRSWIAPLKVRLLLIFTVGTYVAWLQLFAIYRYIIPLEMLSPLIIVAAISLLPLPKIAKLATVIVVLVGAQALAWKGEEPRFGWSGHYVDVAVPKIADPANSLILMTETVPAAYVIPAFPHEIPFLRIQGWLVGSKDTASGFGAGMHQRVGAHTGPLYVLYWPVERAGTIIALADYSLALDDSACQPVETNIQAPLDQGKPLLLCPLTRISR